MHFFWALPETSGSQTHGGPEPGGLEGLIRNANPRTRPPKTLNLQSGVWDLETYIFHKHPKDSSGRPSQEQCGKSQQERFTKG